MIDDAVKRQQERRRRAAAATQGLRKQRLSERKRMHGEDNGDGISQGRKEVIQIDLPAERRGGLSSSECPDLVFEFFKFLMYMRGQLPDTYDNLVESEKHDAAAIPSITRTKKRQKRSNFDLLHEKVEGTFASLVQAGVMASGCSCEVVFVFGAAARRPREAYLIRIHTRPEKTLNGPPPFEVKRGLSQKLNRAVVMHLTNSNLKDLPRTCKVHILFRSSGIPRHSEPKGFFHNPGFDFRRLKVNVRTILSLN